MNAGVMEESPAGSLLEGPGARLKAVRKAQGLDLSRAASLLHLSEDKLTALEADDYDNLPGSVFIQGYLRNYARLLGVAVEPLLSAYHELGGGPEAQPNLRITRVRHEVGSGHGLVRLMTWGIVIGLIALVVIWWRGYLQWPMQRGTSALDSPSEVTETPELGPDGAVPLSPLPDLMAEFGSEIDDRGEASLALPAAEGPSSPAQTEVPGESEATVSVDAGPMPPLAETPAVVPEADRTGPAPPVARGERQIVVEFEGDSWTEIRDSSGTFKILGSMNAGSRRVLEGTPPYKVVLGNASVVRILVDGQRFDLTPFIRGNVARFTLDP